MKRIPALLGALCLSVALVGCGGDSREDIVSNVITLMDTAASDVKTIKNRVNEAVEKSKKENAPLDLTEAAKAAEKLGQTGQYVQARKRDVEVVRTMIDPEEKKEYAEKFRPRVNAAFGELVKQRKELNEALERAEQVSKEKADELRAKIREAEAPFESVARQQ